MDNRSIGAKYEEIAMDYLIKKGYIELGKNYYSRYGELDLICKDKEKGEIVFVEVKYRRNSQYGNGLESITRSKQRKLVKTALLVALEPSWFPSNRSSRPLKMSGLCKKTSIGKSCSKQSRRLLVATKTVRKSPNLSYTDKSNNFFSSSSLRLT